MKDVYTRKGRILLAAAAVSIGSFTFIAPSFAADPDEPADNPNAMDRDMNKPADSVKDTASDQQRNLDMVDAKAADKIRETIADVTEEACSKGGYNDVVKHFVVADRTRLQSFKPTDGFDRLDGRVESFQKNWKEKYGQGFDYEKNAKVVLSSSFARITQGETGGSRTPAGGMYKEPGMTPSTPGTPQSSTPGSYQGTGAGSSGTSGMGQGSSGVSGSSSGLGQHGQGTGMDTGKAGGSDANKAIGHNLTSVIISASANGKEPALTIPVVQESSDSWKLDVPDSIDGQRLHDNLLKQLTMVDEDRANWPADVNEGYRNVTRHILSAIMDGSTMHASLDR